jgi:ABC-type Fe3+/spermidine/putrescine transport system ATPase subunit
MSLALAGVEKRLGDFALAGLSLSIEAGEYGVLLGPSGSGKSVLLSLVAGLAVPDAGTIAIAGRDVTRLAPELRSVGLVFQQPSLFPHLDVRENLAYGLAVRGVPKPERAKRVDELIGRLGLGEIAKRPVATLSGGEGQRVAIARALAPRPALLLLDEPLSLLDHNARLELQAELKRLHAELRLTTLHVTHSREEARALGDRCAVLLHGRLAQVGPTEEVFARPASPDVAQFLGVS